MAFDPLLRPHRTAPRAAGSWRRVLPGLTATVALGFATIGACDTSNTYNPPPPTSGTPATASGGQTTSCFNVVFDNACGICMRQSCCDELVACDNDLDCRLCLSKPDACGVNERYEALFACELGGCAEKCLAQFGEHCGTDSDCISDACLSSNTCSKTCDGQGDCPAGDDWTCVDEGEGGFCHCSATGSEVCDGHDDDCDGQIDNEAPCGANEVCAEGACNCPLETCGTDCVDTTKSPTHCGGCDSPCSDGDACCSASCADLLSDPVNCGACGHDCLGGDCYFGFCEPLILGEDFTSETNALALTANDVYFGGTDVVSRVSKQGGDVTAIYEGAISPRAIVVNGSTLFVTSSGPGALYSMGLTGSNPVTLTSGSPLVGLAVKETFVYFVDSGSGQIARIPTAGGLKTVLATETPGIVDQLAILDNDVFYTTNDELRRVAITGGGAETISYGHEFAYAVAADNSRVYWSDDYGIYSISKTDAFDQVSYEFGVRSITADLTHVYWTNEYGTVRRANKSTGAVETLAYGQDSPEAIAVDDQAIYWTNRYEGTVYKLAK